MSTRAFSQGPGRQSRGDRGAGRSAPAARWASPRWRSSPSRTADALHVRLADEAVPIGPGPSRESYLRVDRVLDAAKATGAEAVHPGYGFLAENAGFARACEDAGLVFIGPRSETITLMGEKTSARREAVAAGVPVVPGTLEPVADGAEVAREAARIGFPVMLKAAAGGGGKGLRLVGSADRARRRRCPRPVGGQWGVRRRPHLHREGDRAAAARRGPGPRRSPRQRGPPLRARVLHPAAPPEGDRGEPVARSSPPSCARRMGDLAVALARRAGYVNAGTLEFLVDADREPYFLEMNTRLQVEHPVTEMVTGVDLVKLQIRVAAGRAPSAAAARRRPARPRHRVPRLRRGPGEGLPAEPGHDRGAARPRAARACATTRASTRGGRSRSTTIRCSRSSWSGERTARRPSGGCVGRWRSTGWSGSGRRFPSSRASSRAPRSWPETSTPRSSTPSSRRGSDPGGGRIAVAVAAAAIRALEDRRATRTSPAGSGVPAWRAAGLREAHRSRQGSQG